MPLFIKKGFVYGLFTAANFYLFFFSFPVAQI